MTEIDERIVAMQFDNKNFEKHAKETIKTLEELRENLDMDDAAKSIENLAKSSEGLDFEQAADNAERFHSAISGVSKLSSKVFSAFTSPIRNISNAFSTLASDVQKWFGIDVARTIEQTAIKAARALTTAPVGAGFDKYTEETNSVASIFYAVKNKGKDLKDVYGTLEKLGEYSDYTSYSYTQMTNAMSRFVAKGIDMEDSEQMLEGIANAAAKAGVSVRDAQRVFTNMADAIGKGKLVKEDWKSLQLVGFNSEELQKEFIQAAIEAGTLDSKGRIKASKKGKLTEVTVDNFDDMLKTGFITNDVMKKVFTKYADRSTEFGQEAFEAAQKARTFQDAIDSVNDSLSTGWKTSFRHIFGDMDEATDMWTGWADRIIDDLSKISEQRNSLLNAWRGKGTDEDGKNFVFARPDGREQMINGIDGIISIIEKLAQAGSKAMEEVFGKFTYKDLLKITGAFERVSTGINRWLGSINDEGSRLNKIVKILKGVLAPIKLIAKVIKAIGTVLAAVIAPLIDPILDFLATGGELIADLVDGILDPGKFFAGLGTRFQDLWKNLRQAIFGSGIDERTGERVFINPLGAIFDGVSEAIANFVGSIKDGTFFAEVGQWISEKWEGLLDLILGPKAFNFEKGKVVRTGPIGRLFDSISESISEGFDELKKNPVIQQISSKMEEVFGQITNFATDPNLGVKLRAKVAGIFQTIKEFFVGRTDSDGDRYLSGFELFVLNIKKTIDGQIPLITGAWDSVTVWFSQANTDVTNFVANIGAWGGWAEISDWFTNVWNAISSFWTENVSSGKTWQSIRMWFSEVHRTISGFIQRAKRWSGWEAIGSFFTNVWDSISVWWNEKHPDGITWESVKSWIGSVHQTVSEFITNVGSWSHNLGLDTYFDTYIMQPIRELFGFLFPKAAAEDLADSSVWNGFSVIDDITSSVTGAWTDDKKKEITDVQEDLTTTLEGVAGAPDKAFSETNGNQGSIIDRVTSWFNEKTAKITEAWNSVKGTVTTIATDIHDGFLTVKDAFDQIIDFIVNSPWDEWLNTFNEKLTSTGTALTVFNTGLNIGGVFSFLGGLGKKNKGIGTFFSGLNETIGKFSDLKINNEGFTEAGKGINSFFTNIGEGTKTFLGDIGSKIKDKNFFKDLGKATGAYKESATTSTQRIQTAANVIIEFAGAVALMSYAITELINKVKEINELDPKQEEKIWQDFQSLFLTIGASLGITEILTAINSFGSQKGTSLGSSLMGFAVAIEGMILAVKQIIELTKDGTDIQPAIGVLAELGLIMSLGNGGKSSGLIGFAIAITGMVNAVQKIAEVAKDLPPKQMRTVKETIAEIAGLIIGFEAFKNLTSLQFGESFKSGGKSSGLIGFALAVTSLVNGVAKLASLPADQLKQGREAIDAISGMLLKFVALKEIGSLLGGSMDTSNFSYQGGKGKTGLIGFIAAITAMIIEMAVVGKMDQTQVENGMNVIDKLGGLITVFTGIFNATSGFGTAGTRIAAIVGLVLFAGALAGLIYAISEIAKAPKEQFDNMITIIDKLGILVAGLFGGEAFVLMANLAAGAGASSLLGALIAVGDIAIGIAGLAAIIVGLGALSDAWPDMTKFLEKGIEISGLLGKFIGSFVGGISGSIVKANEIGKAEGQAEGLISLSEITKDLDEGDFDRLNLVVTKMKDLSLSLRGFDPTIFGKVFNGDITVGQFAEYMKELGGGLKSFHDNLGTNFSTEIVTNGIGLLSSFAAACLAFNDVDSFQLNDAIGALIRLSNNEDLLGNQTMNWDGLIPLFEGLGVAAGKGIENGLGKISAESIVDSIRKNLNSGEFTSGSVQTMIEEWLFGNQQEDTLLGNIRTIGLDTVDSLVAGLSEGENGLTDELSKYGNVLLDGFQQTADDLANGNIDYSTALDNMFNFAQTGFSGDNGLMSGSKKALEQAGEMANQTVANGLTGTRKILYDAGKNAGYYLDMGIAAGIIDYRSIPENAATAVGISVAQAFRDANKVESPSRVFAEIGMYLMQGLGIGIQNGEGFGISAIRQSADDYLSTMRNELAPLAAAIAEDVDTQPTITPVLDTTNLRQGVNSIGSMFGTRYGVNAGLSGFNQNFRVPDVAINSSTLNSAVDRINERLDILADRVTHMQVVLDTGALVGNTVAAYDRALGARAAKAMRA